MEKFFDKIRKTFNDILFPEEIKCIFCDKDINHFDEKPYCNECEKSLPFNNEKRCKKCDMEIFGDGEVCDFCKSNHKVFDKTRAVFKYESVVRKTVLNFKENNQKFLAKPMASIMHNSLPQDMKDFDVIVPVPLSPKSLKRRGYNQSEFLAIEIAKLCEKPALLDVLLKERETQHQKELSYKDRQQNLAGAFKIQHRNLIKDKKILLIDDVMTTGATANACSEILKKFCKKVYVLTFARNMLEQKEKKKQKI